MLNPEVAGFASIEIKQPIFTIYLVPTSLLVALIPEASSYTNPEYSRIRNSSLQSCFHVSINAFITQTVHLYTVIYTFFAFLLLLIVLLFLDISLTK